jgi:HEXXH motif-containing protein
MTLRFDALASPFDGDFLGVASGLLKDLFVAVAGRMQTMATQHGLPVPNLATEALMQPGAALRSWSPEISAVLNGLKPRLERQDAQWLLAQFALASYTSQWLDEFAAQIPGRRALFVAGQTIVGTELSVRATADELEIGGAGPTQRFMKTQIGAGAPRWARDPQQDVVSFGRWATVLMSDGEWITHWPPRHTAAERTTDLAASRAVLRQAGEIMEASLPEYYVWVSGMLREVLASRAPEPGVSASGSFMTWFGHVQMSLASVVKTIDMLVHETSHQYFHLARLFDPLCQHDAPAVYSVLKKTHRPLERVLLGYHAAGNMWLALTTLRERGGDMDARELEQEICQTSALVAGLDASLRGEHERHLTESGASLYETLRQRLCDRGFEGRSRAADEGIGVASG